MLLTRAAAWGRDGGHSYALGRTLLWMFGDTFTPKGMLSSTAGWSPRRDPLILWEETADDGSPLPFLPLTAEEEEFDRTHARPPKCCLRWRDCPTGRPYCQCESGTDCRVRIALWPGDAVGSLGPLVTVLYEGFFIGAAPWDFQRIGVGVADVRSGRTVASRRRHGGRPLWVFGPDEPGFARGTSLGPQGRGYFYTWADWNRRGCSVDVLLARAPRQLVGNRDSYRFWTGSGWSEEVAEARPVLSGVPAGLGSVAWHPGLRAYVSVWMDHCTEGRLLLRFSGAPEGPWSEPLQVDLRPLGATREAYYGWQHPGLSDRRSIVVSYYQPFAEVEGQIRLVRLWLSP